MSRSAAFRPDPGHLLGRGHRLVHVTSVQVALEHRHSPLLITMMGIALRTPH